MDSVGQEFRNVRMETTLLCSLTPVVLAGIIDKLEARTLGLENLLPRWFLHLFLIQGWEG